MKDINKELILEKKYSILKPIQKSRKAGEVAYGDYQLLFNDIFENEIFVD